MPRRIGNAPLTIRLVGSRVLQCHTRGDRRFAPFNCEVRAFGRVDSIENHYQRAKRFGQIAPADWREAKALNRMRRRQTGWRIGEISVAARSNAAGTSFAINDPGVQFYIMLWYRYLRSHPTLVAVARTFDEFEDPFRGDFPFCQADVIRKVAREGVESLRPMFAQLESWMRAGVAERAWRAA